MELRPDQVQVLIEFLTAQESLLKCISSHDEEDAEEGLRMVYQLITAYGREAREGKKSDKLIETTKPNILPIFIPPTNSPFNLPGLGIIIDSGKIVKFVEQNVLGPHKK